MIAAPLGEWTICTRKCCGSAHSEENTPSPETCRKTARALPGESNRHVEKSTQESVRAWRISIDVTVQTIERSELTTLAREILAQEAQAIQAMAERLGDEFAQAVDLVLACQGRVVTTGMGKSGAVARKIAGTLASTGSPALFLHPAEGVHGDLGMVSTGDVLLALSNSGDTEELNAILPAIARIAVPIIAFTGRPDSALGRAATVVLNTAVEREVCPFNLAPTTSTTAQIAMGDALAIAVMRRRKFTSKDYARLHPRGALGRRLLLTVGDIMRTGANVACVTPDSPLRDVLFTITRAHAGAALVTDADNRLLGFIADGDIRRILLEDEEALGKPCGPRMNGSPRTVVPDRLAAETLATMQGPPQISELPVLDAEGRVLGVLYLKDLLQAGIL